MLMMTKKTNKVDGCDLVDRKRESSNLTAVIECAEEEKEGKREGVTWHVGMLSMVLLRAGWTTEDVVYSLDLRNDKDVVVLEGKPGWCSKLRDHHESSMKRV